MHDFCKVLGDSHLFSESRDHDINDTILFYATDTTFFLVSFDILVSRHFHNIAWLYMISMVWARVMVFNATFNNISAISWRSVLLEEETGVPGENHRPVASHWQTLSHNVCIEYTWHENMISKTQYHFVKMCFFVILYNYILLLVDINHVSTS